MRWWLAEGRQDYLEEGRVQSTCLLFDDHAEDLHHIKVLLVLVAARLSLYARHLKRMIPARQHPCCHGQHP